LAKYSEDIQPLLQKGKLITGKRPLVLISDGAPNFHEAYKKEFFTLKSPRTKHISHIRLQGDHKFHILHICFEYILLVRHKVKLKKLAIFVSVMWRQLTLF
jgi:hypothetical protein